MYSDRISRSTLLVLGVTVMFAISSFVMYSTTAAAAEIKVTLDGAQEVPPVKSAGAGTGSLMIGTDRTVSGSVKSSGIAGTAAHIHEAAPGKNGPVIIQLAKDGNTYAVPVGAKLTEPQYVSFQAGNLYINVHTTAHPDGELRGQLKP